jgi:hypothetical protein
MQEAHQTVPPKLMDLGGSSYGGRKRSKFTRKHNFAQFFLHLNGIAIHTRYIRYNPVNSMSRFFTIVPHKNLEGEEHKK